MASFRLCLFFIHVLFRLHQCFDSWSFGALWSDGTLAALTELMQFSYTSLNTSKHHKPKVTLPVTFSSSRAVCWPRSTQGLFKWPVLSLYVPAALQFSHFPSRLLLALPLLLPPENWPKHPKESCRAAFFVQKPMHSLDLTSLGDATACCQSRFYFHAVLKRYLILRLGLSGWIKQ